MTKFTKMDWINAGFQALDEEGASAIKAERIASRIGVSKGSFYGYFSSIQDFQNEMLESWVEAATIAIIERHQGENFELVAFLELITRDIESLPFNTRRAESAIREWGRVNGEIRQKIDSVDQLRIEFLQRFFDASWKAQVVYQAWVGGEVLDEPENKDYLLKLWQILIE